MKTRKHKARALEFTWDQSEPFALVMEKTEQQRDEERRAWAAEARAVVDATPFFAELAREQAADVLDGIERKGFEE